MKKVRKLLRLLTRTCVVGVVVAFAGYLFGIRLLKFPGDSMAPSVKSGDTLVALLAPMHVRAVHRFDLVVFDLPPEFARENAAWHAVPWMKRLVGLPGEHVHIDGTGITVAGEKLNLPVDVNAQPLDVQLRDDEYFVPGENLKSSVDSRSFGPLKRGLLRGYVWRVIHHHS